MGIIKKLSACKTIQEVSFAVSEFVEDLGFKNHWIADVKYRPDIICYTVPKKIITGYIEGRYYVGDPICDHIAKGGGNYFLSDYIRYLGSSPIKGQSESMSDWYNFLLGNSIMDIYYIPMTLESSSTKMALCLMRGKKEKESDFTKKLAAVKSKFDILTEVLECFLPELDQPIMTTQHTDGSLWHKLKYKKCIDLLLVMSQGNSLKEASQIMHISLDTANKHMATLKQGLGSPSVLQCYARAVQDGLIKMNDSLGMSGNGKAKGVPIRDSKLWPEQATTQETRITEAHRELTNKPVQRLREATVIRMS